MTLIEMVVALTVLSVVAMLAVPMINLPVRNWQEASTRRALGSELRLAKLRLDDELARALPGSVRHRQVGARHWLEFMPVRASAHARDGLAPGPQACPVACSAPGNNDSLETGCSETCFRTLGPWVGDPVQPGTDWLVVHPRQPGAAGDPYLGGGVVVPAGIKTRIVSLAPSIDGVQVNVGPKAFTSLAPSRRVWAVAEAVSYECDPLSGRLLRHSGYGIRAAQPTAFAGAVTDQVAGSVSACRVGVTNDTVRLPLQHVAMQLRVQWAAGAGLESAESLWQWTVREQ